MKFPVSRLRKLYKQKLIRFKKIRVRRAWRKRDDEKKIHTDNKTLQHMQEVLRDCKSRNEEFIFGDECLFNQKHLPNFAWSNKRTNITATQIVKYEPFVAVVGAISATRGVILNHLRAKSIKSEDFLTFLVMLKEKTPGKCTLLLDNASIHRTHKVQEYADANDIRIVYNVAYSPWLNGIEEYWGFAK